MPDATITSTASTFGTISGTFASDQSTITGTITGVVSGTLTGSVGVPGPQGPAGPGSTWGGIAGVLSNQLDLQAALDLKAPIASPVFTGDARAVTPAFGDNDTSISTTAFVQAALAGGTAVAKNLEVYVRNQSGSTIPAGSIVYISGATGNRPLITLAQANNDANSAQTIGFVKESIANNGFGYVIIRGDLENIDTSALTEGVQLYLSPTTAGAWTTTKPSAPQHLVYVGIVVRSHPTQGTILVAVQNGYELDELHDVAIASKANNNLLAYESATNLWKNKTYSALGLLTSADAASTYYLASNPSGYQTAGQVSTALAPYLLSSTASATYQTQAAMSAYLTTSAAAAGYYPLTGNPSGFLTAASLSGYATQAWVDAQGYLQAGALTGYALESWVTSQGYLTSGSLVGYATESYVTSALTGYATESWVSGQGYETTANAAATYYPLTNPDGFITTSSLSGYATESWVTSQGYLTSSALTGYATESWVTSQGYLTSSALTGYATESWVTAGFYPLTGNPSSFLVAADISGKANLSGATFTGLVNTAASTTTTSGFRLPHGTAPSAPVNGDVWSTTGNIQWRRNGSTQTIPNQGTSNTFSAGAKQTVSHSATTAGLNIGPVAGDPSSLANGDVWLNSTTNDLKARINGVTETIAEQSWVTAQGYLTSAPVTSVAGKTGVVTLVNTDISGLGTISTVNDAPSDGSTYGRNNGAWVVAGGGGGGGTDYQAYTTAGTFTWTKPAGAKWVDIVMFGGGGGGGSGARRATTSIRGGGGGGSGGGILLARMAASSLGATESVVVGAAGTGGASASADNTSGANGVAGGNSTFSIFTARAGGAGLAGTNTAGGSGSPATFSWIFGSTSQTISSGPGGAGSTSGGNVGTALSYLSAYASSSGAGGAGATASSTASAAGAAGGSKTAPTSAQSGIASVSGGAGGTTGGTPPTSGVNGAATTGGTGGGSGAYRTAVAGMAGADGGFHGGGGGGGSASDNGFASGAGGGGGGGAVYIITYC